jgi:hypothetical protein
MRKLTGSRNRGWLPAIRRRLESYGGHVGNRLSVAAGVALVAGMLAAFAPRAEAVSAIGGTVTNYSTGSGPSLTNWTAHIFTNTAAATSIVFSVGGSVEYLVVAGGGSGGSSQGHNSYGSGGGGAGGLKTGSTNVTASSYGIYVGAGGLAVGGGGPVGVQGNNGETSSFSVVVSTGGGGGGYGTSGQGSNGSIGGSGGGGGSAGNKTGGSGVAGQGYAGGAGKDGSPDYAGGGGGGAGTNGSDAVNDAAGNGGYGITNSISGVEKAYAGGGGGSSEDATSLGQGGSGIGGNGGFIQNPGGTDATAGAVNTGSGGGGGGNSTYSGAGGSGIVIVRYVTMAAVPTITVTPDTLAFGTVFLSPTATKTLTNTVSGSDLTDNITVTAPCPEFEISTNNVDFTNTYTLVQVSGTVPTTTNYVRFTSSVVSNYDGYITNTSSGAATETIHVTAEAIEPQPVFQPASPASLDFGNVITNKPYTKTLQVSGDYLADNVTVTVPSSYFTLSSDNVNFSGDPLVLTTNAAGSVNATIWVRFIPTSFGNYGGAITNISGSLTQTVAVAGTGVVQTLYLGSETVAFGYVLTNTTPANQSFTLWGSNLEDNVTVTAPAAFAVSTNASTGFGQSCTVLVANVSSPSGGSLPSTMVYVRFTPSAVQPYSENITCSSVGAISQNKAVSGNGVVPTLYVSGTLAFGDVITNKTTFSQSYTVTGSNLLANVSVNPPAGFKVSTNSGSGFGSSLTLTTNAAGNLPVTTVYVRFNPIAVQNYSSSITNSSTGAANGLQAVTGNGVASIVGPVSSVGDIVFVTNLNGKAYGVHVFTTTNVTYNFAPSKDVTVEYLVVAGGGGGGSAGNGNGSYMPGGGGAGGMVTGTVTLTGTGAYPITVGGGGSGGAYVQNVASNGGNGANSAFGSITNAIGGGGGGGGASADNKAGLNGGSGGGSASPRTVLTPAFGYGTAGQGNDGNVGIIGGQYGGGGGGGKGNAGYAANGNNGGNGGEGASSSISGTATFYAGGGGGGVEGSNGTKGSGGSGVGGTGGNDGTAATAGQTNRGGGGGGAGSDGTGGNGGSGIVIIRYEIPPPKGTVILLR